MHYRPPQLYSHELADMSSRLEETVHRGLSRLTPHSKVDLFFRADDIGVPSHGFSQLIELFQKYELPLCLALVPSWITKRRFLQLRDVTGNDDTLWCWHQHGRLHKNFELSGKKQEFGPAREKHVVKKHLAQGQQRLTSIVGESFAPFFTPPWNRMSLEAVEALKELGFRATSRFQDAKPDSSHILYDIQVNVDLHTRKEPTGEESFSALLTQLESSLASGRCGIMIHHQRMNERAFRLLEQLLTILSNHPAINHKRFEDFLG